MAVVTFEVEVPKQSSKVAMPLVLVVVHLTPFALVEEEAESIDPLWANGMPGD